MLGIIGDIARAILPTPDRHTASGRRARNREIREADRLSSLMLTVRPQKAKDRWGTYR